MNKEIIDLLEEAEPVVRMAKKSYEALRALEQTPTGNEQMLFEICCKVDQALAKLKAPEPNEFREKVENRLPKFLPDSYEGMKSLCATLTDTVKEACFVIDQLQAKLDRAEAKLEEAGKDFYHIHRHPEDVCIDSYNFMEKYKAKSKKEGGE